MLKLKFAFFPGDILGRYSQNTLGQQVIGKKNGRPIQQLVWTCHFHKNTQPSLVLQIYLQKKSAHLIFSPFSKMNKNTKEIEKIHRFLFESEN